MRVAPLLLTGVTLALAGAGLYLTTLVAAERGRTHSAAQQRQALEARVRQLERAHSSGLPALAQRSAWAPSGAPVPPPTAPTSASQSSAPPFMLGQPTLQEQLARLADPASRNVQRKFGQLNENALNPGLARELHLSPEEHEELLGLLAEQDLRNEEQALRGALAGHRSAQDGAALDDDIEKQLETLLGNERLAQWDAYQAGLPERRTLIDLRARLADSALSDDAAKQLAEAMREERASFAAETAKVAGPNTYNDAYPERARLPDADFAARVKFREDQIGRAENHYARIRERAALFLSAQQLQRLQEMQETQVLAMRASLLRARTAEQEMQRLRDAAAH